MNSWMKDALDLKPGTFLTSRSNCLGPVVLTKGKRYTVIGVYPVHGDLDSGDSLPKYRNPLRDVHIEIVDDRRKTVRVSYIQFEL